MNENTGHDEAAAEGAQENLKATSDPSYGSGMAFSGNRPDPEQGDGGSTPSRDIQGGREGEYSPQGVTGEVQSSSSYEAGQVASYPARAAAYEEDGVRVVECPHCGGEFRDE